MSEDSEPRLFVHSVIDDAGFSPLEFRALAHLYRRAGNDGRIFSSIASMAVSCGVEEKAFRRALNNLIARNVVQNQERPGQTTDRRINPVSLWHPSPKKGGVVAGSRDRRLNADSLMTPPQNGQYPLPKMGSTPLPKMGRQRISPEGSPRKAIHSSPPKEDQADTSLNAKVAVLSEKLLMGGAPQEYVDGYLTWFNRFALQNSHALLPVDTYTPKLRRQMEIHFSPVRDRGWMKEVVIEAVAVFHRLPDRRGRSGKRRTLQDILWRAY